MYQLLRIDLGLTQTKLEERNSVNADDLLAQLPNARNFMRELLLSENFREGEDYEILVRDDYCLVAGAIEKTCENMKLDLNVGNAQLSLTKISKVIDDVLSKNDSNATEKAHKEKSLKKLSNIMQKLPSQGITISSGHGKPVRVERLPAQNDDNVREIIDEATINCDVKSINRSNNYIIVISNNIEYRLQYNEDSAQALKENIDALLNFNGTQFFRITYIHGIRLSDTKVKGELLKFEPIQEQLL